MCIRDRVKDGRFGAYVTDGVTNATIPKAESVDEIDFDRAVELLSDKRAKGPAAPRTKKAAAKKPAVKKPAVKKAPTAAAKAATAKKAAAVGAATAAKKAADAG